VYSLKDKFEQLKSEHEAAERKASALYGRLGNLKLVGIILIGLDIWWNISGGRDWAKISCGALLLLGVAVLWIWQDRVKGRMEYAQEMIRIYTRYLDRLEGGWTGFEDCGEEFAEPGHPYSGDLDIVGRKSLFQYINVTHTWHGRRALTRDLLSPDYADDELLRRQEAVEELGGLPEFSAHLERYTTQVGVTEEIVDVLDELRAYKPFMPQWVAWMVTFLPAVTWTIVILLGGLWLGNFALPAAIAVVVHMVIWIAGLVPARNYVGRTGDIPHKLRHYSEAFEALQGQQFQSDKLKMLQSTLVTGEASAAKALDALQKLAARINVKSSGMVWFVVNILFLWDFSCAIGLSQWKERYAGSCGRWFDSLGEFEALLSLSVLPKVCSQVCRPLFSKESKMLWGEEVGHPLLLDSERVCNPLELRDRILIISGSNLSGKTTYLRTAGINLVLANAGGLVCARAFETSRFVLATSMRIVDDLNEGISTFYAELRRIKGIVEMAGSCPNLLFLIDEIFRGTNSVDRLYGAQMVLSRLDNMGAVGMITTHDMDLCDLEETGGRIYNYSFSERYVDGGIQFDYRIRPDRSTTTNAKYLMEMVGIL